MFGGFYLAHPAREAAIGDFDNRGEAKLFADFANPAFVKDRTARCRDTMGAQQFGQIDLIGTTQDRFRVVDHGNAFFARTFGKAIGVMIQCGGFADQQRIEFRKMVEILGGDQFGLCPQITGGLNKQGQGVAVRWWQDRIGIIQDRDKGRWRVAAAGGFAHTSAQIGTDRAFEGRQIFGAKLV